MSLSITPDQLAKQVMRGKYMRGEVSTPEGAPTLNRQIKLMTKHRKDRCPAGVTHAYGGRHKGHTTATTHAHDGRRMGRKTREKRKWERRKTEGKGHKREKEGEESWKEKDIKERIEEKKDGRKKE